MRKTTFLVGLFLCVVLLCATAGGGREGGQAATPVKLQRIEYDARSPTGGLKVPIVDKTVSFSMISNNGAHFSPGWAVISETLKKLNLDIKVTEVDEASYPDKINIMIASDTLPDVIWSIGNYSKIDRLGSAKLLLPIDTYFDVMPNLRNYLSKHPEVKTDITAIDGHVYSLFQEGYYSPYGVSDEWNYRVEVFDQYKVDPKFNTFDDFYAGLKKIRDAKPDAYPWINRWGIGHVIDFLKDGFGTGNDLIYYDKAKDEWRFPGGEANFREMLRYVNKLYKDKLLHPEFITMDSTPYYDIVLKSPYIGGAVFNEASSWPTWLNGQDKDYPGITLCEMQPPVSNLPGAVRGIRQSGVIITEGAGHAISAKAKNPEVIAKWIDYLCSDEGKFWAHFGVEGKTFKWADYEGQKVPVAMVHDQSDMYTDYVIHIQWGTGFGDAGFQVLSPSYKLQPPFVSQRTVVAQETYVKNGWALLRDPRVNFTDFELEYVINKAAELQKYVDENMAKFAIGEKSLDKDWDAYVADLKKMGVDDLVGMYMKAWNRAKALKK
jgi:putative aldouronate transport system substrate-binding protein